MVYNETPTKGTTMSHMKAVLFAPENYPLILQEMGIPLVVLERVKQNPKPRAEDFYFIPRYITTEGVPTSWMAVSQSTLDEQFTYNKDWIKTTFVTITRK